MNQFLLLVSGLVVTGLSIASEPIINIPKIAGKSKPEIASILGKPSSCKTGKYGEKFSYNTGQTEIVFINKKADWITVEDLDNVSYDPSAIESLGLKTAAPTFQNDLTVRWERIQGLLEVSIFPSGPKIDYAYIKVSTK